MIKSSRGESLLWGGLLLLAAALRFFWLDNKPLHFDESINGHFVGLMWEQGYYRYDPTNFHGPLLFYLFQVSELIWGQGVWAFRFVTSLFSLASVALLFFYRAELGRQGAFMAASALALSPAFVFFGRSGIHEAPFVFFQIWTTLSILRWLGHGGIRGAWGLALGLTGQLLLKETFALWFVSAVLAMGYLYREWNWLGIWRSVQKHLWLIGACVLVWAALFSSLGQNPQGLLDFFRAYFPWLKTGLGDSGHEKEFTYWLELLARWEPWLFVGFAGAWVGAMQKVPLLRFLGIHALLLFLIYSAIPYKTPWCLLSVAASFALLFGFMAQSFWDMMKKKPRGLFVGFLFLSLAAFYQGYLHAYLNFTEEPPLEHPYVYVQSTIELKDWMEAYQEMTRISPELFLRPVLVALQDPWPFPWILRNQTNVRYVSVPSEFDSEVWFFLGESGCCSEDLHSQSEFDLILHLPIRDGRGEIEFWVRSGEWVQP